MSITEDTKSAWIERIKSGGAIPNCEQEKCANCWSSPPGDGFMVRGPDYIPARVKVPGTEYLLKPLGLDWVKCSTKIWQVLNNPDCRVRRAMDDQSPSPDPHPFVWAFNLQVPSRDNYSAVAYFVATEPAPEGSLIRRFVEGDDGFRNSRLKLIANIVKGPWIVKKAVGEQAICIIGRALSCRFCVEKNFLEVDIDIGSSMLASAIVHLAFGYIRTLTVDIAFVIEGRVSSELPERILGAVRFSELNPASAQSITPFHSCPPGLNSPPPARFWWSIGQGFSNIIQPPAMSANSKIEEKRKVDEK